MRALIMRTAASLIVTASLTLAAQANDLLVMPYACVMIGGRPTLAPAHEQGHRIIGQRERRNFTACSPVNPDMCRSWTVYRFDLDCGGARVPWVSVVAAAAEQDRHVWLEDGRLRLHMGQRWSFAPDDPCARRPGFHDRLGFGRMRRYCADRRALTPPPVVDMPFGFAPMLGIDGIFVNAAGGPSVGTAPWSPPPVADVPAPPPKVARVEPPQAQRPVPARPEVPDFPVAKEVPARPAQPPPQVARVEPPQAQRPVPARPEAPDFPVAKEVPARPPQPLPAQVAIQPAPQVAPPPPPVQVTRAPPAAPAPQATPPAPSSGPVIPKIINRPETATTDVAEKMPPVTTAPNAEASKAAATPPPKERDRQEPAAPPKADLEREGASISLLGAVRGPALSAVAAFAGLALFLLAGFALARRRDRLRHAGMRPRDFAWVPLDGMQTRGNLLRLPAGVHTNPPHPAPGNPMPPAFPTQAMEDGIPRTRAEALQVLGMGVTPDTNEAAMKKIVDGLRASWHPDLATDEPDRQLRELRLKQINVAWDLIQSTRAEV